VRNTRPHPGRRQFPAYSCTVVCAPQKKRAKKEHTQKRKPQPFFAYLVGDEGGLLLQSLLQQSKIKGQVVGGINGIVILLNVGLNALIIQSLDSF